jgi:hypothetical protein
MGANQDASKKIHRSVDLDAILGYVAAWGNAQKTQVCASRGDMQLSLICNAI